ncbi:maturation protein [Escherichia phage MS2]|nr:maturation protein [Escherichia phage MS2]
MRAFSVLDKESETFVPSIRVYADGEVVDNSFSLKYRSNWTPGRFNSTGARTKQWHYPSPYSRGALSVTSVDQGAYKRSGSSWGRPYEEKTGFGFSLDARSCYSLFPVSQNMTYIEVPQNVANRASTEVLQKVTQGNFNLGVALAEARSTASQLATQTIALVKAYTAARRGNWRQALRYLALNEDRKFRSKHVAGRWLELQFGWLPLMSDIQGAYEMLTKVHLQEFLPMRAVRQVGTNVKLDGRLSYPAANYQTTCNISRRIVIWFYINDARLAWLSSLGILNPLGIVWEKVPFSFVVDWLLPVGNMLEGLTAPVGCSYMSGTVTDVITGESIISVDAPYGWTVERQGTAKAQISAMHRGVQFVWPTTGVYVKSPFSMVHTLDALALIRQRLSR